MQQGNDDRAISPAARALAARTDPTDLVDSTVQAICAEVWPEQAADPVFVAALRSSTDDNVRAALGLLTGELTLSQIRPPAEFAFTDLAAQLGISVSEIESAYWIALRRFWRLWFEMATAAAAAGEGTIEEFLGTPTELVIQFLIDVLKLVVARHDAVLETIRRTRDDERRALVLQLVEGGSSLPLDDVERTLGYRFTGVHLAVAVQSLERSRAEQALAGLAERTGAAGSLQVLHGADVWICWLRFAGPLSVDRLAEVTTALGTLDLPVGLGEPGSGLDGFRRTRQDVLSVVTLRRRCPGLGHLVRFHEVSLEVVLLGDEPAARRFIADELGELNGPGERNERARETLLAWLSTGSSARAATRLWLHENTIRMRIGQAEKLLPRDVRERRAEVMAALRMRAVLGEP
ncbi:MAG TPA: helix-turn-helix domain-containing protein [Sporichthyaceae bacterium]|nr:helix-turn-helix domain-containing protein [Sporichthyaceae bacterium]